MDAVWKLLPHIWSQRDGIPPNLTMFLSKHWQHYIAGCCDLVIGVQSSCTSHIQPLELKMPLPVSPHPIGVFIWEPFNRPEHLVSLLHNDNDFCCQDVKFTTTNPSSEVQLAKDVIVKHLLHGHRSNESTLCGSYVVSNDGLCSPFNADINQNMFQHIFSIEFHYENHAHVSGICHLSLNNVLGLRITWLIGYLTQCANSPLMQQFWA